MNELNPIEEKILLNTRALFMRYGIKSITMDDVAREMAISKKTLYQHFSDKNDLVKRVVQRHLDFVSLECNRTFETKSNPIDQMLLMSSLRSEDLHNMHPALLYDLKKYYPECWGLLDKYKNEFVFNRIQSNLKHGVELGLFRGDMKTDIVARFYVYLVDIVMDADGIFRKHYNSKELHREMVTYHLRAVCTRKGLDYLQKRINDPNTI